jgi:ferric enterobactin receptor
MTIKKIIYCISLILLIGTQKLIAQESILSGKVVDTKQLALKFASVQLFDSTGTRVAITITDSLGKFSINKTIYKGSFLVVSFIQYGSKTIFISTINKIINLGQIILSPDQYSLTDVVVQGKKSPINFKVDKQVFNASQFANAANGNAIGLIKNLPGVAVNGQGEISLRGSGSFQVMINGKPTLGDPSFILAQISAASIENIEVITSPGATYDADGKSGIIQIITKAGIEQGWMLQSSMMFGTPPFNNYDNKRYASPQRGSFDMTAGFRKNGWDMNLGFNYLRNDIAGFREGDVNTNINGVFTSFPSNGERSFKRYNTGGRITIGHDSKLGNRWELGAYIGNRFQSRVADLFYNVSHLTSATGVAKHFDYYNENTQDKKGLFSLVNLGYNHKISNQSSINFTLQYEGAKLSGLTTNKNYNNETKSLLFQQTNNPSANPLDAVRFKTDYTIKVNGKTFNAGYQFRNDKQNGEFEYSFKNIGMSQFIIDPLFSSNLKVNNSIHAAYIQFSEKKNKLYTQLGVRGENLSRTLYFSNNNATNSLSLLSLFPSYLFRYDGIKNHVIKTSFTRRVKRTNNFELNPIPEREHSETLEQGDPNLLPELTSLFELGVEKKLQKGTFFMTLYFQDIKNPIQRVNKVFNDTILNRVFTNATKAAQIGLEMNLTNTITPFWQSIFSGNIYNYKIFGSIFDGGIKVNNANWIYSINSTQTFTLQKGLSLQASINYLSNRVTAQGEDGAFLTPHLSLKKTTQDQRWSFQMQWLNIDMGTKLSNRQRITTRGLNFYTTTNYIYETDQLQFSLSYNISKKNRKVILPVSEMAEKEF